MTTPWRVLLNREGYGWRYAKQHVNMIFDAADSEDIGFECLCLADNPGIDNGFDPIIDNREAIPSRPNDMYVDVT